MRQPSDVSGLALRPKVRTLANARRRADPAFQDFQLADSPLYLLVRTAGLYGRQMSQTLKSVGMDLPSWRALMIVHEQNPSSVSELADGAVTPLSTMTRVVQRLEKQGLVRLARRDCDGRVTEVFTTPAGERAALKVRDAASRVYAAAFAGVSSADISILNRTLRELFARLEQII